MDSKNIIIAVLIILVVVVVGVFAFSQPAPTTQDGKLNTQINFLSQDNLKNGDQIQIELKDLQGKVLAGQQVKITYEANGKIENYSVITDSQGKAYLTIAGEDTGQHKVKVVYDGNEQYNGCTAEKTITIEEGQGTAANTNANATANTVKYNNQTGKSAQATQTYYDSELNVYYDSNGKVIGGQVAGANIYDLRENSRAMEEAQQKYGTTDSI